LENTPAELGHHGASHPVVRCTSSAKGLGIEELRADLASLAPR